MTKHTGCPPEAKYGYLRARIAIEMSKKDVRCICEEDEEKMDINSEENEAVTIGLDEGAAK